MKFIHLVERATGISIYVRACCCSPKAISDRVVLLCTGELTAPDPGHELVITDYPDYIPGGTN